jgi:hypothetical protein
MSFKGPLQIFRLWRSWGKALNILFQNWAYNTNPQGIMTWNLEWKLGAPHVKESLRGRNFQGGHLLVLEVLSHMHIEIILGYLKINKMKKVHILVWITPVRSQ